MMSKDSLSFCVIVICSKIKMANPILFPKIFPDEPSPYQARPT